MRKKIVTLILLFVFAFSMLSFKNSISLKAVSLKDVMQAKTYQDEEISSSVSLPYRIYIPNTYSEEKEYKLLLMMHGAGERGSDNLAHINFSTGMVFANKIINNSRYNQDFIILAPQCPSNDKWVDWQLTPGEFSIDHTPQTMASKLAASLLFDTINNYSIDMSSIYITGLSMGGFATWEFISRYPGLFAAAMPMCGGVDLNYYQEASLTPIWTFVCSDDTIVPYNQTKQMVEKLKKIGAGVLYTEYSGIGHDSWIPGYQNENAFYWLISQKRKNVYYTSSNKPSPANQIKNVANKGNVEISYIDPTHGIGNKNPNTIRDGRADIDFDVFNSSNKDTYAYLHCDTYGLNQPNEAYFGYTFTEEYEFSKVYYQHGRCFPSGGGYFAEGCKIQALIDENWIDVELTNDPGYPYVAQGVDLTTTASVDFLGYEFEFDPISAKGIRIIGKGGGPQYFSSCAELEVYGIKKQTSQEQQEPQMIEQLQYNPKQYVLDDETIIDMIKGAYIGQMVGVVWGAPTEFSYRGVMIPDSEIPNNASLNYNDAFYQDDLYVEIPFIDALMNEGLDVSVETLGEYFKDTAFPLWHGNDVARTNLEKGIKAPLSGSYLYSSCCEDIDWQIEADFVGMLCPGLVNDAASKGFEWGHVIGYADGAYGGSYVSAMHAKAYTAENILSIIVSGIEAMPKGSKFRQVLDDVLDYYVNDVSFNDCFRMINDKWLDDDRCPREGFGGSALFNIDAKLNAGYCLMGLLYGENDFEETMRLAMKCGQDSDCNPSTVGSILGHFYGYEALDNKFKGVDFDRINFSYTDYSLQDTIDAIYQLAKQNTVKNGNSVNDNIWTYAEEEQITPVRLEVWENMPSIEYTILQTNKTIKLNTKPYYSKGIKSIEWNFGDGNTSNSAEVSHTYARVGKYQLVLTVTGNDNSVATRTIELDIQIDNNIAGTGTPIVSQENPTGSGSRNIEVIIDGTIGKTNGQQYDTYYTNVPPAHEDYFGVVFDRPKTFYKVVFVSGAYFDNGGWFENIKVQARINGNWQDVSLTNDPQYPNATSIAQAGKQYQSYTFEFNNIVCDGLRVIGNPGGSAKFASCSEFMAYAIPEAKFTDDEYDYDFTNNQLVLPFMIDIDNISKVYVDNKQLSNEEVAITAYELTFTKENVVRLFKDESVVKVVLDDNSEFSCKVNLINESVRFEVNHTNVKKEYEIGQQLDLSNLVVNDILADGTIKALTANDYHIETNYSSSIPGTYQVQVSYKEFDTISFDVVVVNDYIEELELLGSYKTEFYVDDEISFDGIIVAAKYSSGKEEIIRDFTIDKSAIENEPGRYSVVIKYGNYTKTFNVRILAKESSDANKKKGCKGAAGSSSLLLFGLYFLLKTRNKSK